MQLPDLTRMTDDELKRLLAKLREEAAGVPEDQLIWGGVDIVRAELAARGALELGE